MMKATSICASYTRLVVAAAAFALAGGLVAAEDGEAARIRAEISSLKDKFARERRALGHADEFGNFNLTEEGRKIEALEKRLRELGGASGVQASETALKAGWGKVPLGAPGDLKVNTEFRNKPAFAPPPKRGPGVKLFGDGVKATIHVASGGKPARALADEFAWHLGQMTGADFKVEDGEPSRGPAVVFRLSPGDECRAVVSRRGDVLELAGVGPGLGPATTYALEAIGCRYIWPGESGKVIPKKSVVVMPDISLDFTPALKIRGVRAGGRGMKPGDRIYDSLKRLGYVPEEFSRLSRAARVDRKGNRGFWQWHGVNDSKSADGYFSPEARYRWGHYYADYPAKYGETHPEWFALQPDGRRYWKGMTRPCFCMSNDELAKETTKNLIAAFRAEPGVLALSACLPDGGHSSFCMCEACRRLDPVNARPLGFGVFYPTRSSFPYVARTDRVFDFFNRIAEGVTAELPGKKLCVYAYSSYNEPPVKVKPHPALVILTVAGGYISADSYGTARRTVAAWSGFGNPVLWRPNALGAYRAYIPHSIARRIFDDIELFKANGLIGTDFDCMDSCWATRGFDYYMVARALLNPDRLDFDTIYADYLAAAFGPAAPEMREWFDSLAADVDAVAAKEIKEERGARKGIYVRGFDVDKYAAILARAEKAAVGDGAVLRRLKMMRTGLEYGEWLRRRATTGGKTRQDELLKGYYDFIRDKLSTPDGIVAVNAGGAGFYDGHLVKYLRGVEAQKMKASRKSAEKDAKGKGRRK